MFFPVLEAPKDWSSVDAQALRNFLESESGKRTVQWILFRTPDLQDGADVNKTLVASGVHGGYKLCLENLFRLTVEQPVEVTKTPVSEYPSLDDDDAWKKIESENNQKTP